MKSVYSAVRTGSLNKAVCASSLRVKSINLFIESIYWSLCSRLHYRKIHRTRWLTFHAVCL